MAVVMVEARRVQRQISRQMLSMLSTSRQMPSMLDTMHVLFCFVNPIFEELLLSRVSFLCRQTWDNLVWPDPCCFVFINWYWGIVLAPGIPEKRAKGDARTIRKSRTSLPGLNLSPFDWCCVYYFVRNSLVALLEALCARCISRVYACYVTCTPSYWGFLPTLLLYSFKNSFLSNPLVMCNLISIEVASQ